MDDATDTAKSTVDFGHDDDSIGSRFGDITDLPDKLLTQMVGHGTPKDEQDILNVLDGDLSSVGTIDEILVALYRREGSVIHDRKTLAARITRMVKKGSLISVEGKRGVYAVRDTNI